MASPKEKIIANIEAIIDWPKKGIVFRDISPVLNDPELFHLFIDELAALYKDASFDKIAGIDARGFVLASALAYKLGKGLILVRKKGKLPPKTVFEDYALEYGTAGLEIKEDAALPGEKILLVDDVLATGGTMAAAVSVLEKIGAEVIGTLFAIELEALGGKIKLGDKKVKSLIAY